MRIAYEYRPDGLRHSNTVDGVQTTHIFDGDSIIAEAAGSGNLSARYLRGIGLIAREQDDALQYYLHNAHGDVVQRLDSWGNLLRHYRYDAFGVEKEPEPLDSNPFRYCGEYFDTETGTVYLRARYYNPRNGRFCAEDSIKSATYKLPNGQEVVDPLSLNLYTYCHNNPIMFVDPSGNLREPKIDLGKGWYAEIEKADPRNNVKRHVHLYKKGKEWSQNDDGSPHDKNNNSPGSPPKKVLERLKEKTGWDWNAKMEEFADQVDIKSIIIVGGTVPYALLTYPDGSQAMVMDPGGMAMGYIDQDGNLQRGISAKKIWNAYLQSSSPQDGLQPAMPGNSGPYLLPAPGPSIPFGFPSPAPFGFPAFGF